MSFFMLDRLPPVETAPPVFIDHRQNRNENDADDYHFEVLCHPWHVAEPVAGEQAHSNPSQSSDHVVENEFGICHGSDARYEWCEGSYDRHEPSHDDGLATVLLIKGVRPLQVFRIKKPGLFPLE